MPKKYYAVAVGRTTGVFETWEACKEQVHGHAGAKYKSFKTLQEANEFCRGTRSTTDAPTAVVTKNSKQGTKRRPAATKEQNPTTKKRLLFDVGRPRISIMFDGGARGNPGVAGAGAEVLVYTKDKKRKTIHVRYYVGDNKTNNEAEYQGLISGLQAAAKEVEAGADPEKMIIQGDSKLIIQQLTGNWKCRKEHLIPLYEQAKGLIRLIEQKSNCVTVLEHVYRNDNRVADGLANAAMDAHRSWMTTSNDDHKEEAPFSLSSL